MAKRSTRTLRELIEKCYAIPAYYIQGLHEQGIRQPGHFPPDIGPATITVTGIGGKSVTLSVSELSNLPHRTVKATDHGTPATFEGVLLTDVLARVDLPLGEKFHNTGA